MMCDLYKYITITYFFIFCPFLIQAEKHTLSVCAIFRDDGMYLKEWIDFHLKQGVEHFYLYDNFSEDHPLEILDSYINKKQVTYVSWNKAHETSDQWNRVQCDSYLHCAKKFKDNSKWIAFIDTDEFLFCPDGKSIPDFLHSYKAYGAVVANWMCYGTSNVCKVDQGKILESLMFRCVDNDDSTFSMKSIVQPKFIKDCNNPHFMILKKNHAVNENYQKIKGAIAHVSSVNKIRINHYLFRDKYFMMNVKVKRMKSQGRDVKDFINNEKNFNIIYDPVIINNI